MSNSDKTLPGTPHAIRRSQQPLTGSAETQPPACRDRHNRGLFVPIESESLSFNALVGSYRIRRRIGVGRTAEVYEARHAVTERNVAIKILRTNLRDSGNLVTLMRREAIVTSMFRSPNVVACLDAGTHDGRPWIALERLLGESLRSRLDGKQVLPFQLLCWTRQAAIALDVIHRHGIVHQDIRPENLFIEADQVVLLDFGSCASEGRTPNGEPDDIPPVFEYMAPELVERGRADRRSDIYSLGLCLYEGMLGHHPFADEAGPWPGETMGATRQLGEFPAPLPDVVSGFPRNVWQIMERCLEKVPGLRYNDASALEGEILAAYQTLRGR